MSYNTLWFEKAESRQASIGLTQPQATLHFIGKNALAADDDTDANLSFLAVVPLLYPGFFYAALGFRSYEIKPLGGVAYEASPATYIRQDSLYVFDTGGGTVKIHMQPSVLPRRLRSFGRHANGGRTGEQRQRWRDSGGRGHHGRTECGHGPVLRHAEPLSPVGRRLSRS